MPHLGGMSSLPRLASPLSFLALGVSLALLGTGCAATTHPVVAAALAKTPTTRALSSVVDEPGPVTVETIDSATWSVDRSGLLNLDDPKARAAHLTDGLEPVQLYFHVLRHPTRGVFLIDSGAERALRDAPKDAAIRGLVAMVAHTDRMKISRPLGDYLATLRDAEGRPEEPTGMFLTHLHVDHVAGLRDLPRSVPVYVGPGEVDHRAFDHLFTAGIVDEGMRGHSPFLELSFTPDPEQVFEGVRDLFGDGTVWALWTPGHTPGSTSFLVRSPTGPVLFTGDACHTRWGWENGVEPGEFSADRPRSRRSLDALRAFAAKHPAMTVKLGHQP
jgi:N-acyl homoserine lactone hydrolase